MDEPVTLESGRTFEKELIVNYFEYQKELAIKVEEEAEEEDRIGVDQRITCPVSLKVVDPSILIPNLQIKFATEQFLEKNPWAYRQNRKENWMKMHIWDDSQ